MCMKTRCHKMIKCYAFKTFYLKKTKKLINRKSLNKKFIVFKRKTLNFISYVSTIESSTG